MATPRAGQVRVRLAPSPTGLFHFGTARTGLFNWLFAKANKGKFILRIEDTDRERSEVKYESEIIEGLTWLGLDWDEGPNKKGKYGPYRQNERSAIYSKYLEGLLNKKSAYYCYCTKEELEAVRQLMLADGLVPKYSGNCRNLTSAPRGRSPQVIRFKTPEVSVEFKDIIRGQVKFDATLWGDMVIAKDLNTPLYNFAVAVDDEEMKISHVIRGEDHLSNTPKQILIQRALGFKEPIYAHLPLILGSNRAKLSKRHMEISLLDYRNRGYLPEAVVNFLVLLGWHPQNNEEIFTPEELIGVFDLKRVQKSGGIFNEEKLDWVNAAHIKRLSTEELARHLRIFLESGKLGSVILKDEVLFKKVVALEQPRLTKLSDFAESAIFFFVLPEYEPSLLIWQKTDKNKTREVLTRIKELVGEHSKDAENLIKTLADKEGRGEIFWPLRVALSGRKSSPDPLEILNVLGQKESIKRLEIAINKLAN